jgi:transposase
MSTRKLPGDAFEYYFALGPARSYRAVADHFGCSKTTVGNTATRENWAGRIAERERKAQEKVEERAIETLADVRSRHLKMVRTVEAKALEGLRQLPLETGMECVRALDMALKAERLILGEPTERHATDIEAIIKREHERWLVWTRPEEAEGAG